MKNIILVFIFFLFPNLYAQNKDILLEAMSEELTRSYENLKNAEKSPLYFLQYEAWDEKNFWISANLGAINSENESAQIIVTADMRIGNGKLDNTHEIKGKEGRNWEANSKDIETVISPLDDKDAIKVKLWNLTDKAYKDALNKYLKVEMNKQVTAEEEDKSGDFTDDKTTDNFYERAKELKFDKEKIRKMLKS